jgi:hypothetical protein
MEAKRFKQLIDEFAAAYHGKKVGKKYVWLHNDLAIFLDVQRSEFKQKTFFVNVSYFLCAVTGLPDIEAFEYLGDVCFRFNASLNAEEYFDAFAIEEIDNDVDIRNTLKREFNYFIEKVSTSAELGNLIKNSRNVKPFMKAVAEKHFDISPPKKKSFLGLFKL